MERLKVAMNAAFPAAHKINVAVIEKSAIIKAVLFASATVTFVLSVKLGKVKLPENKRYMDINASKLKKMYNTKGPLMLFWCK